MIKIYSGLAIVENCDSSKDEEIRVQILLQEIPIGSAGQHEQDQIIRVRGDLSMTELLGNFLPKNKKNTMKKKRFYFKGRNHHHQKIFRT